MSLSRLLTKSTRKNRFNIFMQKLEIFSSRKNNLGSLRLFGTQLLINYILYTK